MDNISVISVCSSSSNRQSPPPVIEQDPNSEALSIISVGSDSVDGPQPPPPPPENTIEQNCTTNAVLDTTLLGEHEKVRQWINSCQTNVDNHLTLIVYDSDDNNPSELLEVNPFYGLYECKATKSQLTQSPLHTYMKRAHTSHPVSKDQDTVVSVPTQLRTKSVEDEPHNAVPSNGKEASGGQEAICSEHDCSSSLSSSVLTISAPLYTYVKTTQTTCMPDENQNKDTCNKPSQCSTKCVDETHQNPDGSGELTETHSCTSQERRSSNTSPHLENQKKEFCSYLQLMNPSDQEQTAILEFRRSRRVKNLKTVTEQEEVILEENADNSNLPQIQCARSSEEVKKRGKRAILNNVNVKNLKLKLKMKLVRLGEPRSLRDKKLTNNKRNGNIFRRKRMQQRGGAKVFAKRNFCANSGASPRESYINMSVGPELNEALDTNIENGYTSSNCSNVQTVEVTKPNKFLPLPSKCFYEQEVDFDGYLNEIIEEVAQERRTVNGQCQQLFTSSSESVGDSSEKNYRPKPPRKQKKKFSWKPKNVLRSRGLLKHLTLKEVMTLSSITRRQRLRERTRRQQRIRERKKKEIKGRIQRAPQQLNKPQKLVATNKKRQTKENYESVDEETEYMEPKTIITRINYYKDDMAQKQMDNSRCQIITVNTNSDDENTDFQNIMDDILEFNSLSEERKREFILGRILNSESLVNLLKQKTSPRNKSNLCSDDLKKRANTIKERINYDKNLTNSDKSETLLSDVDSRCEILTVCTNSDDENVDFRSFLDDFDSPNEDNRRRAILARILTSESLVNFINEEKTSKDEKIERVCKIFTNFSNEFLLDNVKRSSELVTNSKTSSCSVSPTENREPTLNGTTKKISNCASNGVLPEHNYAAVDEGMLCDSPEEEDYDENEDETGDLDAESITEVDNNSNSNPRTSSPYEDSVKSDDMSFSKICTNSEVTEVLPINRKVRMKTLHRSLFVPKRKISSLVNAHQADSGWESDTGDNRKKLNHSISVEKTNGSVLNAIYINNNLIICQQCSVGFWTQSALGNILGSQNMWIPNGRIQRLLFNNKYNQKRANEMVITTDTSVVYTELWTKEHRSDFRERPVTDIFVMIYFKNSLHSKTGQRSTQLEKKALQLENINGSSDDVQYAVFTTASKIVVSWYANVGLEKRTNVHSHVLASDFQMVSCSNEMAPVGHYVSSLHNVEDSENLLLGCGENRVTLWDIEYGYIIATIELSDIPARVAAVWTKCDRGFLFTIHECSNKELRLIAINGMSHTWKNLRKYKPPYEFNRLKGVCLDNGILIGFYDEGIMCWNAETGEPLIEETPTETEYFPSGKHVIMISNDHVIVKHSLSHFITATEDI